MRLPTSPPATTPTAGSLIPGRRPEHLPELVWVPVDADHQPIVSKPDHCFQAGLATIVSKPDHCFRSGAPTIVSDGLPVGARWRLESSRPPAAREHRRLLGMARGRELVRGVSPDGRDVVGLAVWVCGARRDVRLVRVRVEGPPGVVRTVGVVWGSVESAVTP